MSWHHDYYNAMRRGAMAPFGCCGRARFGQLGTDEWFFIWLQGAFSGYFYGKRHQAAMLVGALGAPWGVTDSANQPVLPLGIPEQATPALPWPGVLWPGGAGGGGLSGEDFWPFK